MFLASLTIQLIAFRCAPPLRIRGTSDAHQGQVMLPAANWAMAIATIAISASELESGLTSTAGVFRTSERLSHAYVLSTAGVMLGASPTLRLF